MKKVTLPRLSGWLVASVALFVVIGWTSSAQIPVVSYKLSLVSLSAVLSAGGNRSLLKRPEPELPYQSPFLVPILSPFF